MELKNKPLVMILAGVTAIVGSVISSGCYETYYKGTPGNYSQSNSSRSNNYVDQHPSNTYSRDPPNTRTRSNSRRANQRGIDRAKIRASRSRRENERIVGRMRRRIGR